MVYKSTFEFFSSYFRLGKEIIFAHYGIFWGSSDPNYRKGYKEGFGRLKGCNISQYDVQKYI